MLVHLFSCMFSLSCVSLTLCRVSEEGLYSVMEVEFEDFCAVPLEVSLEVHNFVIRFYY